MKKTIIALMALAGIACGATTIDAQFTSVPNSTGYDYYISSYTFEFTLDSSFTIDNSGSVLAYMRGDAKSDNYGYNAITLGVSDDSLKLTIGRGKAVDTTSDATGIDADTTFNYQDFKTFSTTIKKGVTYTLTATMTQVANGGTYDNGSPKYDGMVSGVLTWNGGTSSVEAYKSNMNGGGALVVAVNPGIATVPEPTTATLSLLALAGLAARRRRK